MKESTKLAIKEWVESILIAVILALFIRAFFIQAFKIPTGSMKPTLKEGDKIMVNKLIFGPKIPFTNFRFPGIKEPKRGDIIVFIYPEDRKKDFIKRLVALGGDTLEIM
jgi:signal peptidase I